MVLRPLWGKYFQWNGLFGFGLILLFGIPRFIIVLRANQSGDYRFVSIIFLLMWVAPFVLLTREGRRAIGMTRPAYPLRLLLAFVAGAVACTILFIIAKLCFDNTVSNWFVYIARSYSLTDHILHAERFEKFLFFMSYALVGMTFSPVGEELLYRGMIHGCFSARLGERKASRVDSLAFALTHLAHFGIVYVAGSWSFLFLPGFLWVLFMFGTSVLFFYCKAKTGSLAGAIFCHAGFNVAMTYFIFYYIII